MITGGDANLHDPPQFLILHSRIFRPLDYMVGRPMCASSEMLARASGLSGNKSHLSIIQRRRYQDELAKMFLFEELALRVRNPFEGKRLRYERPQLAALDVGNKV